MEQQPVELYQFTDSNKIVHFYCDDGYVYEYDDKNDKDLGARKMTEEDHQFLNKKLDSMNKAFKSAYEGMARMSKDKEKDKFKD